jgi:hypothetical protein
MQQINPEDLQRLMFRVMPVSFALTIGLLIGLLVGISPLLLFPVLLVCFVATVLFLAKSMGKQFLQSAALARQRGEDPLAGMTWNARRGTGLWGFKVRNGRDVGGGLYATIKLEAGEGVDLATSSMQANGRLRADSGYLILTNRRVLFTGQRIPPLKGRTILLPFPEIGAVTVAKRHNVGAFLGSLSDAVVISKLEGKEYIFWPSLIDKTALVGRIEEKRRGL